MNSSRFDHYDPGYLTTRLMQSFSVSTQEELALALSKRVAEVMKLTELYFIHGNHDTDTQEKHDFLFNSSIADRNLHGRIVEIDGFKVAGLGGVFRQRIWWPKNDVNAESNYDNYEAYVKAEMQASWWQEIRRQKALPNIYSSSVYTMISTSN